MRKLFLIDGHGLVYRAYYALPYLSTSQGLPTNAVYGFANMLFKLLKEAKQTTTSNKYYLAVVFDSPVPTFRHIEYKEYKATRPKVPDDFKIQLPYIYKLLEAMNITVISKEGYEADDLIASIKTKYINYFDELVIVSGDKDVFALVDNKTKVMMPLKGFSDVVIYDTARVMDKLGVEPSQVIDFLSLVGDNSDNIPGVLGIGNKSASLLIKKFGSVEEILANLDKLPDKVRENITKSREQLMLSKRLIKAVIYDRLNLDISSCLLSFEFDNKKLLSILSELEFKSIIGELNLEVEEGGDYKLITTKEAFLQLIEEARLAKQLSIMTKIDNLSHIIGIGLCIKPYKAFYIPIHNDNSRLNWLLPLLKTLLEERNIKKYAYSIKKELLIYKNYGINPTSFELDISLGFHLLNPHLKPTLAEISMSLLNYPLIIDKKIKFEELSIEIAKEHICKEVDVINRCRDKISLRLKELNLEDLYYKIEHPLIDVLTYIEHIGIKVDVDYLTSLSRELSDELDSLKMKIYEVCGSEFNINSPKQVSFILFEKLKLPMQKKTKTQLSTDEEVLHKLVSIHPAPGLILDYRELTKLKSSYLDILPLLMNKKTKRVHTTYNQTQTATGRLSSSEPNLQNIPVDNRLRRAFIPEPGYLFLSADYSQIELRILAHISKDKKLIDIFKEGRDVHQETSFILFGAKDKDKDTQDKLRRKAKVINFGIIYGMSAYGLSKELNISPKEAQSIISKYFDKYEGVRKYIEETVEFARENGYVMTLWGRRRYLPHIRSNNHQLREFSERQAINTPIQGSAADLIKLAMINIYTKIKDMEDIRMILQVHDELLFEVSLSRVEEWRELIKNYMENVVKLEVDLEVRTKIGPNWADMQ